MVKWLWVCAALMACAGDASGGSRGQRADDPPPPKMPSEPAACISGSSKSCACPTGSGVERCVDGEYAACDCSAVHTSTRDASVPAVGLEHCEPGLYVGTFTCDYTSPMFATPIHIEGPVQFRLEVDETRVKSETCDEFCTDLVISEGSGELFGFANLFIGFACTLEGGLDCTTGEFRATAVSGEYGLPVSSNPADPMAPAIVSQPPWGTFDGTLDGTHGGALPEAIDGNWALNEMTQGGTCAGPFTVQRMP